MSITQTEYPDVTGPRQTEPHSIVLVVDGKPDEDLQSLHDEIMTAVNRAKQPHHKVASGICPTNVVDHPKAVLGLQQTTDDRVW